VLIKRPNGTFFRFATELIDAKKIWKSHCIRRYWIIRSSDLSCPGCMVSNNIISSVPMPSDITVLPGKL